MAGRELAFDFGVMFSIWLIGILLVTAFCYGVGDYSVPTFVTNYCTSVGTTPHALGQFLYMIVVIFGLLIFSISVFTRKSI